MDHMTMMAMMMAMTNPKSGMDTAQTVLGASDALGHGGRLAVGLMRQQNVEHERRTELKRVGEEFLEIVPDPSQLSQVDWSKRPGLARALELARPGITTTPPRPNGSTPSLDLCVSVEKVDASELVKPHSHSHSHAHSSATT
jgi:hypothetical protein